MELRTPKKKHLGKHVNFRADEGQDEKLQEILAELQDDNGDLNISDVYRAAFDTYIEGYRKEKKRKMKQRSKKDAPFGAKQAE